MRSRSELHRLTDTELQVATDGLRLSLSRAWGRGEPGSAECLYDLALVTAESQIRGLALRPLRDPRQMTLIELL